MSNTIKKIEKDDIIFNSKIYQEDKLAFNYIEGAKTKESTQLFSDSKRVIICHKPEHNGVWIWTDNDAYNDKDLIINIAKTIKGLNIKKPEFFTKPEIAQIFSDIYALVSNDLDYHIRDEFSLGVYKYNGVDHIPDENSAVLLYNKKFSQNLVQFYSSLADEFHWEQGRAEKMCKDLSELDTYILLKDGDIISLCAIADADDEFSFVSSVATKKDYRNCGYGSLVTSFAAVETVKSGKKLMVYANKGNKAANNTFKKSGFVLVDEIHLIKS